MKAGWRTKRLGDLCEIELGKTPARGNKSFWDEKRETSNVWLSIADLLNTENKLVVDSKEYVSDKGGAICKLVRKGTLLVSFKLTLGRLAFAGRDLFTNEAIAALTIFNEQELSKEFLFYFFTFFDWHKAAENDVKIKGMTLNKAKLKELLVPLPPLPEQERIVGVLDEAFAALATAKADAEKNLVNAKALFESYLEGVFRQRGEGWKEKTIEEIADIEYGYTDKANDSGKFRYIRITDIDKNGTLVSENKVYVDGFKEAGNFLLQDGDLVMARTGATFAKVLLYEDLEPSVFASYLIRIKFTEKILSKLYWYYSKSKIYWNQANQLSSGSAQPQFNGGALKRLLFMYPLSLTEQRSIVERLDALSAKTQRLESIYQRKLAALEELKKSLLQQAFSGEL
jgi:type I restriction enzyme, S subunit